MWMVPPVTEMEEQPDAYGARFTMVRRELCQRSAFESMCVCMCVRVCGTVTLLGDGHGYGSPDAAVGSCDHEGASSHGHLQVLLHKPLGGRQEGIPATSEYFQDFFFFFLVHIVFSDHIPLYCSVFASGLSGNQAGM